MSSGVAAVAARCITAVTSSLSCSGSSSTGAGVVFSLSAGPVKSGLLGRLRERLRMRVRLLPRVCLAPFFGGSVIGTSAPVRGCGGLALPDHTHWSAVHTGEWRDAAFLACDDLLKQWEKCPDCGVK